MYTLDRLGYRGHYDVYDHSGTGGPYNHHHLGGRATVEQATGYGLILYDAGVRSSLVIPDGREVLEGKEVDQAGWFRDWLARGAGSEAGYATLWILGANILESSRPPRPLLYEQFLGVDLVEASQSSDPNPDVEGQGAFAFFTPDGMANADFTHDVYTLQGSCLRRSYDALAALGSAVPTHRYKKAATGQLGSAAMVMNSDPSAG